ncbi:MAG: hypothetical protein ACE5ER_04005 [Nitrospinaceae bacterium]
MGKGAGAGTDSIRLQFRDQPLSQVLDQVREQSGIGFSLAEGLAMDPVSVVLEAPDWDAGVVRILQDYNFIGMRDAAGSLTWVRILNRRSGDRWVPVATPRRRQPLVVDAEHPPPPPPAPIVSLPPSLGKRLAGVKPGATLSRKWRRDPELTAFLKGLGMDSPQQWVLIRGAKGLRAIRGFGAQRDIRNFPFE